MPFSLRSMQKKIFSALIGLSLLLPVAASAATRSVQATARVRIQNAPTKRPIPKKVIVNQRPLRSLRKASSSSASTRTQQTYLLYKEGVIGNGQTSVLFFFASWCPRCIETDNALRDIFGTGTVPVSAYKIDFDDGGELRTRFGVSKEHTFVKIDGKGQMIGKIYGPSVGDLRTFLRQ